MVEFHLIFKKNTIQRVAVVAVVVVALDPIAPSSSWPWLPSSENNVVVALVVGVVVSVAVVVIVAVLVVRRRGRARGRESFSATRRRSIRVSVPSFLLVQFLDTLW